MEPKFQVQLKIAKAVAEVFDAVVKPDKLGGYFVQRANAPLVEGATVKWKFAELEQWFDVIVRQMKPNEQIVFEWPAEDGVYNTRVEMVFKPLDDGKAALVQISESGWRPTESGVKASYENCGGWMHKMCCLKAYLENGINLRAGGTGYGA